MAPEDPSFNLDEAERAALIGLVREVIVGRSEVGLAFVFGSFTRGERFRDLDLAAWVREPLA